MKLTVVHLEGSKQGQTEYLPGPVIAIGRDPANQLAFDPFKDDAVSTRHATVTFQGDQVMIQDLGSRNGTFLNGAKVNGAVPLPNDSVVQFGEKGPKVKLTWVLATGPGKKTQMIHDLSHKLDAAEQDRAAATQAASKSKRNMACCLVLLLVFGGGGAGLWSWWSGKQARAKQVAELKEALPAAKKKAEDKGAAAEADAKADWDAALAAEAKALELEAAGDLAAALAGFQEAEKRFDAAGEAAAGAMLKKLQQQLANAGKLTEDAEAEKRKRDEEIQRAIKAAEEAAAKRIAELERRLTDATALKGELEKLAASTNPDELKQAVAALEKALAENPDDPALKEQLEAFKAKLAKAENVGDLLAKAAKDAKDKVVGLRARVFAIPAGQRPDTTKIRVVVSEAEGSGFFVSGDGLIATAKEVVEPHLFDAKALALHTKLREKGMLFFTDLEVMTSTAAIYTTTFTGDKVVVKRRAGDSFATAAEKVKIPLDNAEVEVEVRPHRRDLGDLVIVKVEGVADRPFLELAKEDPKAGAHLVALGTQKGGADLGLEEGQTGLFLFTGKVKEDGRRPTLELPSYSSWIGGPVLDPDGKVVGLLVEPGTAQSKALGVSVIAEALQ